MKIFHHRWFLLILRVVLGGVFVYAGTLKLVHLLAFADSIATFQLLPSQLINVVALALPPFEILVGAMLLFGIFQRQAAFSLLVLTGIFMLFLFQAAVRGLVVDCGCFGTGKPSAGSAWLALGRDVLLAVGCCWVYLRVFCAERGVKKNPKKPLDKNQSRV